MKINSITVNSLSFLLLLFCLLNSVFSQPDGLTKGERKVLTIKGLQYGFNFGVYFPGNATANYYNGLPNNTLSLKKILLDTFTYIGPGYSVNSVHDSIRNRNFNGDDFAIKEYPQHMRYSIAMNIGFYTKYNFNDNLGIYLEVNYSKLKTTDKVSIERLNMAMGSIQTPYYFTLLDKESRVDINLGMMKAFGPPRIFKPYMEGAFNLNNTRVLSADVNTGYHTYSYLNPYNEYYGIRDDGIGYGVVVGGGLQIVLSQAMVLYTGMDFTIKKIKLGDNKDFNLNSFLYVRLLFRNLISTSEDE